MAVSARHDEAGADTDRTRAYVQLLVNLSEVTRQLARMAGDVFHEFPQLTIAATLPRPLNGAFADVGRLGMTGPDDDDDRRPGSARRPVAKPARRPAPAPKRAPRQGGVVAWVGEPRVAYERTPGASAPDKLPKGARKIWDALTMRRTGPELTKATTQKRKQIEKMIGVLKRQDLIRVIDLRGTAAGAGT